MINQNTSGDLMLRLNLVLLFTLSLASCAQMKANFEKNYCDAEGGYEKGFNDAKEGSDMSGAWVKDCPSDQKNIRAQYNLGYKEGTIAYPRSRRASLIGETPNAGQPQKCSLKIRGDAFLGEGWSQGEAQNNAIQKCNKIHGTLCHTGLCDKI